jgi:hypothetical protein
VRNDKLLAFVDEKYFCRTRLSRSCWSRRYHLNIRKGQQDVKNIVVQFFEKLAQKAIELSCFEEVA